MYAQEIKPEQKIYAEGIKEVTKLESENGKKLNVMHKAYEAAVAELGYSDKELMDNTKARKVVKLMFSDKYLGNEKFNPLLGESELYKEFAKKGGVEQQRLYQHMLGTNLDSFVSSQGIIEQYGGLRRGAFGQAVERQQDRQVTQQMMSWAWTKAYDPDKPLEENIQSYMKILQQDPILAHTGTELDAGKFQSIDDIASTVTSSMKGQTSREGFQYQHGADFN
jgi:hypothetical protein